MATNKTTLLLAGILAFAWSCDLREPDLSGVKTDLASAPVKLPPREALVQTAIGEIGVSEEGGNNRGKRIGQYLALTGLGQGHPWCAAFTKFVYEENTIPTPGATAWSPSWFPKSRTYWSRGNDPATIQKADIFGLHYANLGRIGHVGIIEKVDDKWLYTIEGNTGDDQGRDGDVVRRHKRSIKTITKISNWIE